MGVFRRFPQIDLAGILPPVQPRKEVGGVEGTMSLIGRWLYGTGMRMMEDISLRVKDVYFDRGQVIVREEKGVFPSRSQGKDQLGAAAAACA